VRGACLELALRHWTIGQHGVWGGLVPAERAALRHQWLASGRNTGRVPFISESADRGRGARSRPIAATR
jgi:hypothetical protein